MNLSYIVMRQMIFLHLHQIFVLLSKNFHLLVKNFATDAKSSPFPILFIGCILAILSAIFSFLSKKFDIFEFVKLGAIQFTLMFGAYSAAERVKPSTAAFADETMHGLENLVCCHC